MMSRHESNSDEAIDRLVAGLREVEPPAGMESRILDGARARAEMRRGWILSTLLGSARAWTVIATSFALVAVAISWVVLRSERDERQSAGVRMQDANVAPLPQPAAVAEAKPLQRALGKRLVLTTAEPRAQEVSPEIKELSDEDARAVSDLHAPSQPAPAMPLTEQEEFLIHMIHRGDPVELAMLDPKFRSNEEASSRADFERFFTPPPPPKPAPLDIKSTNGDTK